MRHLVRTTIAAALIALGAAGAASAATFTVNSTADLADATPGNGVCATAGGVCTLRAAVNEANNLLGPDTISVPAGIYTLSAPITITTPLTLSGVGARSAIIDGANGQPVLQVNSAAVNIHGVSLTGGAQGAQVSGTDVIFDEVAIRDNTGTSTTFSGAGLFLTSTANVLVRRSTISGNTLNANNDATGGGIFVANGAVLTVIASTIAANQALAPFDNTFGGGVFVNTGGTATFRHVTFSANRTDGAGASEVGGNLYVFSGALVTIDDTIMTGGIAAFGPNCWIVGTLNRTGRNLDSGTSCGLPAGQISNTDPQLAPFGNYGGQTDTAPPTLASPARDGAVACPDGGLDQRRNPAPSGAGCEIGAAEIGADVEVVLETASRSTAVPDGDITYVLRVVNNGGDPAAQTVLDVRFGGAAAVVLASPTVGTCTTAVRCDLGTLAPGQTAKVTLTARAGRSGPMTMSANATSALPDPNGANNSAAHTAADVTAPTLSALRLLTVPPRTNRPIRLRTTVGETATVTMRIDRILPGRRRGRVCSTAATSGTRCTALRRVGTVRNGVGAGVRTLVIPRRVAGRRLLPGRYRITATAADVAGNRSAARTLTITVRP